MNIVRCPVAAPTITEHRDGGDVVTLVLNWPDDQPDVCLVTREVLAQLVETINELRTVPYV